jgi:hypothetical protein
MDMGPDLFDTLPEGNDRWVRVKHLVRWKSKKPIHFFRREKLSRKVSRHTFYYDFKNQYEIDVAELFRLKNFWPEV